MNYKINNIHATHDITDEAEYIEVDIHLSTNTEKQVCIFSYLIDDKIEIEDIDLFKPIANDTDVIHLEEYNKQEIVDFINDNQEYIVSYIKSHDIPVFDFTTHEEEMEV